MNDTVRFAELVEYSANKEKYSCFECYLEEKELAEKMLQHEDKEIVTKKLLEITFNNENWKWVQEMCLNLLDNEDEDIKGLAVTCLGHIARIHGKIDKERVLKAFADRKEEKTIAGRIEDAIQDIEMFTNK